MTAIRWGLDLILAAVAISSNAQLIDHRNAGMRRDNESNETSGVNIRHYRGQML
jgi:hypothetical protein